MSESKRAWGLFRKREVWLPTWRGWLAMLLVAAVLVLTVGPRTYGFLAVNDPLHGGVLVVEGWSPDYAMMQVVDEFYKHPYRKVFVTGGPIEHGVPFSELKTYAEFGAALLLRLGLSTNDVLAVPSPAVCKDRTYTSALALKRWFAEHQVADPQVNLCTMGTHARRSRMLFEKGLGPSARVGVMAIEPTDYDPAHWWRYSASVRGVISEMIAYIYARFFFTAPAG